MTARDRLIARMTDWSETRDNDIASDVRMLLGVVGDLQDELAATKAPAGLPAVLSSVEDVARVAAAAGLADNRNPDFTGARSDDGSWYDAEHGTIEVWATERGWGASAGRYQADVEWHSPSALLWHAIQAARGGEPDV